jgi:glycosyltransferase involved in cell wall biosynthesis
MTSLRIVVALPHLGVYGGIRRFLELGRVWIERGHEVAIAIPYPSRGEGPWLPFSGQIVGHAALRERGWNVLLSPDPAIFAAATAPGALRVFYSVLEGAPGAPRAWRSADLVLANSAGMRRWLAGRGIEATDAAGAVNTALFRPPDRDPRPERAGKRAPVQALVFGRMARKRKGSWAAARAVEQAALRTGIATELTLFDAPPAGSDAPALPRALEIPHRWVLRPSQEELAALYGTSDIFVSAERRAGWCNTAAEAMACGAALACTRSGTEDFAVAGETALVARWPVGWNLTRSVAALLSQPGLRMRLAENGRKRIDAFTWDRTAERIEQAILDRMEGGSHGAVSP